MILPEKKSWRRKIVQGGKEKCNVERNDLPFLPMSSIKFTGNSVKQLSMRYCCVTSTSAFDSSYFTNQKDFGRASPISCAAKVLLFFGVFYA